MSGSRKRRSGSMFKWYFIQTSVSVLVCLTFASFSVLFFFLNFWINDRLTALHDDALSVAQSVYLLAEDNTSVAIGYAQEETQMIHNIINSVAMSSSSEIFVTDNEGSILICYDMNESNLNMEADNYPCSLHSFINFSEKIISGIDVAGDSFRYEGQLAGFGDEDYLLSGIKAVVGEQTYYVIACQAESVALLPYTTEFLRILIFASIVAVFLSFILSSVIAFRMVRPLKKVTAATKLYASGDFSMRINTSEVYKELGQLVDSVNIMADNLAVLEESRSSFVANVSHELKTPMTIISGFIDGMLDGTISKEDYDKYLLIVSDEVKRLSRLVVAMLNMSKIEAGKLTLNLSTFSLGKIFFKTFLGFEKYIEEKRIEIIGLDKIENIVVSADETLINQIIYNLIDNAVKFTPEGGTITVALAEEKKEAVFSVKNTGKGISQEEIGLIFDRFYKVDKSRGLDAKSFGMGLYIVKSIVELHSGTISVSSEPDEYTEFTINLPLQ